MEMSRRFSEEQTIQFVKLYRELEPLWNVNHPHYKKQNIRIACLEKIIEELNLSDFCSRDVLIKIKNLRSTYCQEVNKIKKSMIEDKTGHIYQPGLKWFPDMDYIMRNSGNARVKNVIPELPGNDLFYLQEEVVGPPIEIKIFDQQGLQEGLREIETPNKPKENGTVKVVKAYRRSLKKNNPIKTNCCTRWHKNNVLSQRFSEEQTLRFVKLYRELEPLWNICHPDYKRRDIRLTCLEKIVEEMNLSDFCPRDAMTKINNLRSTYCQELNKIHNSLTEGKPGGIYQPILKWFPDMDYVMTNCGKVNTKTLMNMDFPDFYTQEEIIETPSEIKISDTKIDTSEQQDQSDITEIVMYEENGMMKMNESSELPKQRNQPKITTECPKSKVNSAVKEKKTYNQGLRKFLSMNSTRINSFNNQYKNVISNKISEAIHDLASLSKNLRTQALQNEKTEDECDIVGRHVALQLRELPPARRLQAQLEIQKVLCNCRLSILETGQTTCSNV